MSLKHNLKGHTSTSKAPGSDQSWSQANAGPFLGIVKNNKDPVRMGRLKVFIPSLAKTNSPVESQLVTCEYLAPFYGAKGERYTNGASREYNDSQHSYGMWMVPPDLETKVLVIFAEGKMEQAYWIGCIQDPYTNHMIPGIASSENTWDTVIGEQDGPPGTPQNTLDKIKTYGTKNVPSGELNRNTPGALTNGNYESTRKPIHPFAETLKEQGLIDDTIRGTTSSSARRETPSQVFGISTPGRKNAGTNKRKVGAKDSPEQDFVSRGTGHTFVMDDGAIDGTNQLTRLRTSTGHQLLLHDTAGVVYLANGSGNSWIEMTKDGKISVYSADGINIRTEGNFDMHSDGDINFHARNSIKFTAENELVNNANFVMHVGENGIFTSSPKGGVQTYGKTSITSFSSGPQLHGAGGRIDLAGSQVHFNSVGASSSWGPTWLNAKSAGIVEDTSTNDVNLTVEDGILKANTRKTKTTVSDLVTHEPYIRAESYPVDSVASWENEKQWQKLSKTPGTLEYIAQKNRESKIESIRNGQYKADISNYVKKKLGSNTSITKANEFAKTFNKTYNSIHNVKTVISNPVVKAEELFKKKVIGGEITNISSIVKTNLTNKITSVASSIRGAFSRFFG